jgi:ectoine hydroxylase-related dioxygenase (phytanoyl-CoA dioxygenase family)
MFKDISYKENFERLGFYKLPLLSEDAISQLKKLYSAEYENNINNVDMTVTHNTGKRDVAYAVHKKIESIVEGELNNNFQNFKIFASHFSVKNSHSNTSFQLHQDWCIVDEQKYKNYQIWIPLDFSYPENGGMCFIPESHLFFNNVRSGSMGITHIPIEEELYPYVSYLRLMQGEGVVFYNNTLHGSFINSTPYKRIAVIVNIVEAHASTLYYHLNTDNTIDTYKLNTELLFKHLPELEKGAIPLTEKIESGIENNFFDNKLINKNLLIEKIHQQNTAKNRALDYEHKLYHILKDSKLEAEINHLGFSVIPLLNERKVDEIQQFFNEIFGTDRSQYPSSYSSVSSANAAQRKQILAFLKQKINDELAVHFNDFRIGISLLYSRKPDNNFFLDWHSDPSIILNEALEPCYGIWCPLVDIDESSGGFLVVPGSHRLSNKINGSFQTWGWGFEKERRVLDNFGVGFRLRAGEALIFDTRMPHGSKPNFSDKHRDNFVIRVLPKNLTMINMHYKGGNEGYIFTQDEDYFIEDTVRRHNELPYTGNNIGDYYIFKQEDIDSNNIIQKLQIIELEKFEKINPNRIFFSHR